LTDINASYEESSSSFKIPTNQIQLQILLKQLLLNINDIEFHLENSIRINPSILDFSKWAIYLPIKYQCEILKEKYFDFTNTKTFIENINLVCLK
jgi:ATP-dependent Lhr-like helicase